MTTTTTKNEIGKKTFNDMEPQDIIMLNKEEWMRVWYNTNKNRCRLGPKMMRFKCENDYKKYKELQVEQLKKLKKDGLTMEFLNKMTNNLEQTIPPI